MIAAVANAISFWFVVESSIVAEWSDNGVLLASRGLVTTRRVTTRNNIVKNVNKIR